MVTAMAAGFPLAGASTMDGLSLLHFWLVATIVVLAARAVRCTLAPGRGERRRVIIVGTGPHALRIYRELCADVLTPHCVLGFVDTSVVSASPFLVRRTLGSLDDLEEILVREHVDQICIGLPVGSHYRQIQHALTVCESVGVKATYHADIFDARIARPRVQPAGGAAPLVEMQVVPEGWRLRVKRTLDIVGAAVALVLFSPVMAAAAIAIRMSSDGPVIYAQERYGLNRRRFRMLKFRTMVPDAEQMQASLESLNQADGPVFKIAHDPRITRVGRFLRKTSIDELPQLVNVLRGEMSLVGPRPLPLRDVARFTRTGDMRRFSVRPGLTCLWQVSGRSGIGFDEWVRLDLQYIDRWSLALDLSVLARTVPAVLRGTGAA
jgi:exopolysaccharide biosynthesis polyprenyl glycosylphosphotransferase